MRLPVLSEALLTLLVELIAQTVCMICSAFLLIKKEKFRCEYAPGVSAGFGFAATLKFVCRKNQKLNALSTRFS